MRTVFFFLFLLAATPTFANPIPLSLKGRFQRATFSIGERELTFFAHTKGNISSILELEVEAPKGVTVKASLSPVTGNPRIRAQKSSRFYPITLKTAAQISAQQNRCVSFSPGEGYDESLRPSKDAPICHMIEPSHYAAIQTQLEATLGGGWSFGQVCGFLVDNVFQGIEICDPTIDEACRELLLSFVDGLFPPPTPTPPPLPARVNAARLSYRTYTGVIPRDACGLKNQRQLLKVTVSFKSDRTSPKTIRLAAKEVVYKGDMAATIKPISEGKFAPKPLLLMTYLSMCGQEAFLSRFTSGVQRSIVPVRVEDLIPYNGRVLNRSPIPSLLKGGKGTFTLSNGEAAYGVCFNLTRKRQKVNGY